MSDGDGVKRVKSREFTGISPLQLAGTGVKLVKTRVVFVGFVAARHTFTKIVFEVNRHTLLGIIMDKSDWLQLVSKWHIGFLGGCFGCLFFFNTRKPLSNNSYKHRLSLQIIIRLISIKV